MIVMQAVAFYLPYRVWKHLEGGKLEKILVKVTQYFKNRLWLHPKCGGSRRLRLRNTGIWVPMPYKVMGRNHNPLQHDVEQQNWKQVIWKLQDNTVICQLCQLFRCHVTPWPRPLWQSKWKVKYLIWLGSMYAEPVWFGSTVCMRSQFHVRSGLYLDPDQGIRNKKELQKNL